MVVIVTRLSWRLWWKYKDFGEALEQGWGISVVWINLHMETSMLRFNRCKLWAILGSQTSAGGSSPVQIVSSSGSRQLPSKVH